MSSPKRRRSLPRREILLETSAVIPCLLNPASTGANTLTMPDIEIHASKRMDFSRSSS